MHISEFYKRIFALLVIIGCLGIPATASAFGVAEGENSRLEMTVLYDPQTGREAVVVCDDGLVDYVAEHGDEYDYTAVSWFSTEENCRSFIEERYSSSYVVINVTPRMGWSLVPGREEGQYVPGYCRGNDLVSVWEYPDDTPFLHAERSTLYCLGSNIL
jgi:hypothetical protein